MTSVVVVAYACSFFPGMRACAQNYVSLKAFHFFTLFEGVLYFLIYCLVDKNLGVQQKLIAPTTQKSSFVLGHHPQAGTIMTLQHSGVCWS